MPFSKIYAKKRLKADLAEGKKYFISTGFCHPKIENHFDHNIANLRLYSHFNFFLQSSDWLRIFSKPGGTSYDKDCQVQFEHRVISFPYFFTNKCLKVVCDVLKKKVFDVKAILSGSD